MHRVDRVPVNLIRGLLRGVGEIRTRTPVGLDDFLESRFLTFCPESVDTRKQIVESVILADDDYHDAQSASWHVLLSLLSDSAA